MSRDITEMILEADIETAHANKLMTERERRMYWIERYTAIVRKKCAEACYLRATSWKDNAARAAKLCGDAITAMGEK